MLVAVQMVGQTISWPVANPEARPYTRWWWLGSAVNEEGLLYNLSEYQKAGIGGVEITPIYGVQGNDKNEIQYLSPRWMEILKYTETVGKRLNMEISMATGTGWPFGGPNVPTNEAACCLQKGTTDFQIDRTRQKVKRAAPGGEGLVIDHFDKDAVRHYLDVFDKAFAETGTPYPQTFFNDSYEVYQADWTPRMLSEFQKRRGYDLNDYKTDFFDESSDIHKLIISDYRETLGELLLENFTTQWTDWAHSHGAITRNQAHGSPANLIDIYAAVDIPECEGFGLSDFGILGLRTDKGNTKKNDSDLSMLKYASSAAHISGKRFTSSETFTWLTEHFRTSLSQCKPDFDLMMIAGVNHVFFHGSCYSPKDEEWPGWRFYASVDMTPANNWWSAMPAFSKYIERVQSFMQYGSPDNDVLVYLPYYDMIYEQPGRLLQFDIHSMAKKAPQFISLVTSLLKSGYDCDYISDRYISLLSAENGSIGIKNPQNPHNSHNSNLQSRLMYSAIIIPDVKYMPIETLNQLLALAKKGAKVIVLGNMPQSPPGYGRKSQQKDFTKLVHKLSKELTSEETFRESCTPEYMRKELGLSCIRRSNENGYHYFISNLQGKNVDDWVQLAKPAKSAFFFNPMTGKITRAATRNSNGRDLVHISLQSGESVILLITDNANDNQTIENHKYLTDSPDSVRVLTDWTLTFPKAEPKEIDRAFYVGRLKSWTQLGDPDLKDTMAQGLYTTKFSVPSLTSNLSPLTYILDLGDVRETAKVIVNGVNVGTLFAVPYKIDITEYIKEGENELAIEVCNLPANRIAKLDRDGVKWRKFKEINVVDLNYKNTLYDQWLPMPSGLCSDVKLLVFNK